MDNPDTIGILVSVSRGDDLLYNIDLSAKWKREVFQATKRSISDGFVECMNSSNSLGMLACLMTNDYAEYIPIRKQKLCEPMSRSALFDLEYIQHTMLLRNRVPSIECAAVLYILGICVDRYAMIQNETNPVIVYMLANMPSCGTCTRDRFLELPGFVIRLLNKPDLSETQKMHIAIVTHLCDGDQRYDIYQKLITTEHNDLTDEFERLYD